MGRVDELADETGGQWLCRRPSTSATKGSGPRTDLLLTLVSPIRRDRPNADALHLLGDVATHADRFDAESSEAHYRKALALAEPRGMRPSSPTAISASARRNDKREQTQVLHLGTASTMCHGTDTRLWLDKADAEISGV